MFNQNFNGFFNEIMYQFYKELYLVLKITSKFIKYYNKSKLEANFENSLIDFLVCM